MANVKLSQIASVGAINTATDLVVAVRSGTTDVLVNLAVATFARAISSISSPTTAGAAAQTDYVYFISGTTTLTLPTAVSNTNSYKVKNVDGSLTSTIAATGGQNINGAATLSIPPGQNSFELLSDGSNWHIF